MRCTTTVSVLSIRSHHYMLKGNRSARAIILVVVVVTFIVLVITVNLLVLSMLWITHYEVQPRAK